MTAAHRHVTIIDPRFRFDLRPKSSCFGKRQYSSPAEILELHRHMARRGGQVAPLHAYRCGICHHYHEGRR